MLETVLLNGAHGQSDHIKVSKFRNNGKASYEVLVDAELDEAGMSEFIANLIAMRDGGRVSLSERGATFDTAAASH